MAGQLSALREISIQLRRTVPHASYREAKCTCSDGKQKQREKQLILTFQSNCKEQVHLLQAPLDVRILTLGAVQTCTEL